MNLTIECKVGEKTIGMTHLVITIVSEQIDRVNLVSQNKINCIKMKSS